MPNKAGVWENADFLMDLSLALFQVASNAGALGASARGGIETYLKARGHDQSWESVRNQKPLCCALAPRRIPLFDPPLHTSWTADPIDMPRSQMKWDAAAHEAMLICVFRHCELTTGKMGKVLEEMKQKGYEFTENAFRYDVPANGIVWLSTLLSLFLPRGFPSVHHNLPFPSVMSGKRVWNAASHETLLFAMIEEFRPNKEKITAIVQRMNDMGHAFTFHGVNQHIQKLRKARDTSALDGSGDNSKPSTPRKATPRKTPVSGHKRKAEVDSDTDELASPVKDEAAAAAKATPSKRIKDEPSFDNGDWKNTAFQNVDF
ncbi:hypothetical protein ISF_06354 [Cordyceps fumosorosea ARSEF 2679]|uniref:Uncharacterized protein n=1 Tax=Cordyceps fumosorosea (strain ARSEF 2679) TaxID=1081104 RepID=A0A167SAA1_CORFA|nr:hypothetical protein ISF_06354 [Cordyceps fumosorosea ARSEF 2679]OAA59419.1 hypothetical protein ISF_06354 [Cordyceps fumosorosea ARSEF 2679]